MDKKKKRSFNAFLTAEGTDGVKKVAIEYATENDTVTFVYLEDKYNLSSTAIKKVIDYAITNCIVSYQIATVIREKSRRNQLRHCKSGNSTTPSDEYYAKLLQKRLKVVKNFDNEKVLKAVECYLQNPHLTASSVASSLGFSSKELNVLLKKAIIFNIVDDKKVVEIERVSANKNPIIAPEYELFKCYEMKRKYYKYLNAKIAELQFQLESYDDYFWSDAEQEKTKALWERKLSELKKALDKFVDSF